MFCISDSAGSEIDRPLNHQKKIRSSMFYGIVLILKLIRNLLNSVLAHERGI